MWINTGRILMTVVIALVLSIAMTSFGIAYAGGMRGVGLLGVTLFVTLGIIFVLELIIPLGILLSSVIRAGFSSHR